MRFRLFASYENKLFCAVSNRYGGVSPEPYESFNLGLHVGDDTINVLKNRSQLALEYDFLIENLIYMEQTHSDHIEIIEHAGFNKIENCDALITNQSNIPLMIMVADCIPIMMYDPVNGVIAAIHAGRNGTFKEIAVKTVQKMQSHYGTSQKEVRIALGPSIHACCYEIGNELADITVKNFGKRYIQHREGKDYLDLQTLNYDQLRKLGVPENNIEISTVCTCCDDDYYSYRREGVTGRFAGIIKLK